MFESMKLHVKTLDTAWIIILSHHFLALTFSEDNFGKYHPPYSEHYFSDSMPTMGICK